MTEVAEKPRATSRANVLVAICMVTIMTIYAVSQGENGSIVYAAIGAVAGLGGYELQRTT